ncbi:glycosyltransferase family 4 protein [Cytobacillus oceanisediminis]|uniref:glycosyltransferase family 4 protein n=1 Tax=Cytobacillus oceanisediminis TaxID=665099 RepID=UPI001C92E61F|nr:glycosyltransferase family 4 protein [Cytobacillus oceanisediminis]
MNHKIKVLFLANIPSPYRVDFFNELGKYCELTVLFERGTSDERDLSWYNNKFDNFQAIFLKGKKINRNTALCFGVSKYLKRDLFDIIIVGGYSTPTGMLSIKILRKRKIPFILNTDGGIIKEDSKFKYLLKEHYISSATYWLSTGNHTTNYLIHYGANKENVFTYPFTSLLEKDILASPPHDNLKREIKTKLDIKEDKIILSVGQFIARKGFDILLNACAALPENYGVYIIGGEPTQEYLDLKNNLNLSNVYFIGFKSKEELKEYYLASDLFVLPTREDIWGLVINEAMAYGLPIITTNKCVAGLELINNNENGFIVPVNNSNILSLKINEILRDNSVVERMSKRSLDRIQKYTIEYMAKEHISIFKSILYKDRVYVN